MNFTLSEDLKILKESVRKFMDKEIVPIVNEFEQKKQFPFHILKKLRQFGYIGGLLPEKDGGMGMNHIHLGVLMEEAGRAWGSLRVIVNGCSLSSFIFYQHGNDYQKREYLRPLLLGDKFFWFGLTEPNHGSNAAGIETKAVLRNGFYIVNGSKMFITSGSVLDQGILFAKTDVSKGSKGISALIIDKKQSQYEARDIQKMFIRATTTSELIFEDCKVPQKNLLGNEGEGLKVALAGLNKGRYNVAMGAVGIAQACVEASIKYAKERKQFGRAIGGFQLVQAMIANMLAETEASRLMGFKAGYILDKGLRGDKECSLAKLYASEAAFRVASTALQIHGGYGYTEEFPIERYFRDARGVMIPEGTSQIQKLIIGRILMNMNAIT